MTSQPSQLSAPVRTSTTIASVTRIPAPRKASTAPCVIASRRRCCARLRASHPLIATSNGASSTHRDSSATRTSRASAMRASVSKLALLPDSKRWIVRAATPLAEARRSCVQPRARRNSPIRDRPMCFTLGEGRTAGPRQQPARSRHGARLQSGSLPCTDANVRSDRRARHLPPLDRLLLPALQGRLGRFSDIPSNVAFANVSASPRRAEEVSDPPGTGRPGRCLRPGHPVTCWTIRASRRPPPDRGSRTARPQDHSANPSRRIGPRSR